MDRELKRGTLELILLQLLAEREMYGYEIVAALARRSAGGFEMKEGTLYPVLYRLEQGGLVSPYWRTEDRGTPRKYYRLTDSGAVELARLRSEWQAYVEAVSRLLNPGGS